MLSSIEYETLRDFSSLGTIRQSCASRSNGIQVDNLPLTGFEALGSLESQLPVSLPFPSRVRPNRDYA